MAEADRQRSQDYFFPPQNDPAQVAGLDMAPRPNPMPGWVGSPEDKQRAMNLLNMKRQGQPIEPAASDWLDQYMIWVDRNLPPVRR